eukprot:2645117-Amphidinium_carterae.1
MSSSFAGSIPTSLARQFGFFCFLRDSRWLLQVWEIPAWFHNGTLRAAAETGGRQQAPECDTASSAVT